MERERSLKGVVVVKMGGSTLGSHDTTIEDLVTLQKKGLSLILVHGGGQVISSWLSRQGISSTFVRGLRVTDAETLSMTVAVLAGLVNKELVAAIQKGGGRAIGISGVDGGLLKARIKEPELGYVGEVVKVEVEPLRAVLAAGYMPVVSPVALSLDVAGDTGVLNVNSDSAAGAIAAALEAREFILLTDVKGIKGREGEVVSVLSVAEAEELVAQGVASKGMVPKIDACRVALSAVPRCRVIDGREPHALLREMKGEMEGTTVVKA